MSRSGLLLLLILAALPGKPVVAKPIVLDSGLHHLRAGEQREWSDFPAAGEGTSLSLRFMAGANQQPATLRLRQQDVKQVWKLLLNDRELSRLPPDENDMVIYIPVPAGMVRAGENRLVVEPVDRTPDDIRIGEISLDDRPIAEVLAEATVEVTVLDAGQAGKPVATPCRITILNDRGADDGGGHLGPRVGGPSGRRVHRERQGAVRASGRRLHPLCRSGLRLQRRFSPRLAPRRRNGPQDADHSPRGADRGLGQLRYPRPYPDLLRAWRRQRGGAGGDDCRRGPGTADRDRAQPPDRLPCRRGPPGRCRLFHPGRRQRGDNKRWPLQRLPRSGGRARARLPGEGLEVPVHQHHRAHGGEPRAQARGAPPGYRAQPSARSARRLPPLRPGTACGPDRR